MRKSQGILLLILLLCINVFSQEKPKKEERVNVRFGKIAAEDFTVSSPVIDSNTNAVILSDIGSSEFTGNNDGWFSLVFKRHRRIKVMNTKGFDAATVNIFLYSNGSSTEKLENMRAVTYNLENGNVVSTKLESKDIFEEKQRNGTSKKFTFPAIKPGSIIEYTYSIKSDFLFNLQSWDFQGEYPRLWSEYEVAIPDFFVYVFLSQGYLQVNKGNEERSQSFTIRDNMAVASRASTLSSMVSYHKWSIKDVPALKEESFTSSIENHIAKIEFQLAQHRLPGQPVRDIMGNWPKVAETLLARDDFGATYTRGNGWLDDEIKMIVKNAKDDEEKTRRIYEYLRDNFTCTSTYGTRLSESTSLRDVFKKKSGRVSDINLLLLAMLRHERITAQPVLMSLRDRGVVHPVYPLMDRFNYLVCQVALPSGIVYLDASRPMLGYNKLQPSCYNGVAWVLDESPFSVNLVTDSLKEGKRTSVILINSDKGGMEGAVNAVLGDIESYQLRGKMAKTKKEDYAKEFAKGFTSDISIQDLELDSLQVYDEPVTLRYNLRYNTGEEEILYFNPLLNEAMKNNPFTSAERHYPIEMPYLFDEMFAVTMDVPKGYTVDELPKSVRYKFNEDEGMFEYIVGKTTNGVQMRCRMFIKRANFLPEDYESLREFFSFAIKKQSEQFVFKKTKS